MYVSEGKNKNKIIFSHCFSNYTILLHANLLIKFTILSYQVYVLGTATRAGDPEVHNELLSLLKQYKGIVLLLDPDVAGRQARNMLNKAIIDCWHAFVPSPLAQATQARGYKEIGNIGVEHAPPKAIMEALKRRRRGVEGRTEFSKEKLCELGLAAAEFERVSRRKSALKS